MKKRFFPCIILILSCIGSFMETYAQKGVDNTLFQIEGQVLGKDTGKIAIWYTDALNQPHYDQLWLDQGRFTYAGHIRAVGEVTIVTDLNFRYFDDLSFIRLIAEPGLIKIVKKVGVKKAAISGSTAQIEKEKWDNVKREYTDPEERCFTILDSLRLLDKKNNQLIHSAQIDSLLKKASVYRQKGYKMDVGYIVKHPESYVSGYLLSKLYRQLSIDSVMQFYTTLADSVKLSTVGCELLTKIYALTDNKEFKAKYPLFDPELNKQLLEGTMHNFTLKDITGNPVDFKKFKGKYLVIDIWASWCGPCIANMPAWNELIKKYDNSLIQFINVSIDIDTDDWKQAVTKHNPGGVQLQEPSDFNGLFALYCKVRALPKIIIVDPAGKIINYEGPHPNQPEFKILLDSLVNTKN
ncbi:MULTISPECIES: TlpA family protein disulfide reductase [Niastella]|uniref:TlpA family protein disulfide reductase n=1 Tax=Niastella soli TaxID=2821487 RepID=A0ABS3Z1E1_9BACT|nr:TlpA disulfide reductase family protein [Niastella soli]MBO9203985.1 TlpA family protein disulfide reductase [Niastella soli]